ncbi:MAG: VWA domain-containing protein [Vicinamibacterales bacterium]
MKRTVMLIVLLAMPFLMGAQRLDAPVTQPPDPGAGTPTFRSQADLVVVHATVRDDRGRHVSGLPQQAFRVFENGVARPISVFGNQHEPVTLGLVLDVSGSMEPMRERLAYAASAFAGAGRTDDEVFAIIVGDRPVHVLPDSVPFTSDPQALRTAIVQAHRPGGMTALYDAVAAGLEHLERGSHARRALVVISDGIDNASHIRFDDALQRALASNAAIYAVGLVDPVALTRDPGHLRRLARATGGDAYFPSTNIAAFSSLRQIADDIHQSYALGFTPAGTTASGARHRLDVSVRTADGGTLKVRAREGYVAGPQ